MNAVIRILVVDDQSLFREGLIALLSTLSEVLVVGQAANGVEALRLAHQFQPHVVLMDLRMPIMDGVAATRRLRAELPDARVVVLTTFEDDASIFEALAAGALGYLLKDTDSAGLWEAIRHAARGESFLTPRVATRLVRRVVEGPTNASPMPTPELTTRERQVLTLLGQGASNKDIARALDVVEGTIKNHVTSIFTKLKVSDRLQAALVARELGLVWSPRG